MGAADVDAGAAGQCHAAGDLGLFIAELPSFAGVRIERGHADARRAFVQARPLARREQNE